MTVKSNLNKLPTNVTLRPEAEKDYLSLPPSQQPHVLKAIIKVASNPKPASEGGYGKPLSNLNSNRLAGCLKIKLKKLGIRIVYTHIRKGDRMDIIIIGIRAEEEVYREAARRLLKR